MQPARADSQSANDVGGSLRPFRNKNGRDAGDLCALPPVGINATTSIATIIALKPDCIVANQEGCNIDSVCRFLEAGINIATSRVDFLEPDRMDPEVRRRTEDACRKGHSSIYSTGASPGFSSEARMY
jgi:2,4-diaminopentanoate dehydrogenase